MTEPQTQQLADLRESVAEAQHEAAIVKIRLGAIEQSAQADSRILRSDYIAEVATLRGDMEKRFAAVEKGLAEMRGEMKQGLGDLRGEMDKRFTDLRAEMKQGFTDLRLEIEKRFADSRVQTQKTINAQTKWMVGTMVAGMAGAVAIILTALRYMGPAAG